MKLTVRHTLAAAAVAVALPSMAQAVTLKFHHIWNAQAMASVQVITPWCNKIAAESNNKDRPACCSDNCCTRPASTR